MLSVFLPRVGWTGYSFFKSLTLDNLVQGISKCNGILWLIVRHGECCLVPGAPAGSGQTALLVVKMEGGGV
jgi:hypothetical protein